MRNDKLKQGAAIAIKHMKKRHSSFKTRYNHLKEALRFVDVLRILGYGVKYWKNITNKHVQKVVDYWADKGLAVSTIKEYLSGVRIVAQFWGNERIAKDNKSFGLGKRDYINCKDRSLPQADFNRVVAILERGKVQYDRRFAAMLKLQRYLGLRTEESMKFRPHNSFLEDCQVHITEGTKGGKDRILRQITAEGQAAIECAQSVVPTGSNLIPKDPDMTEMTFRNKYYHRIGILGINKKKSGASSHGNRHAYMQNRYEQIAMFPCRIKFETRHDFVNNAIKTVGSKWKDADQLARKIIKIEAGHGPRRDDVVSQYLGSVAF